MARGAVAVIVSRRTVLGLVPLMPAAIGAVGQGSAPGRLRRFVSGLGGFYLIEPDGRVKVWPLGASVNGRYLALDHDRVVPQYVAQEAPALRGATAIAAGYAGYAVMADGRVLAWGDNANGLLGNTSRGELEATAQPHPPVSTPTPTLPMPKVVDVATMAEHVLALTAEGTVFAWGNGQAGQLGIGDLPVINFKTHTPASIAYVPFPIQVPGLAGVVGIAAGMKHSLAVMKDGTIMAWGENRFGQLGDGTVVNRTRRVAVSGITNAVAVAVGGRDYSAALLADGTVMTWGLGHEGLGHPFEREGPNPIPARVPGVTGATAIACGAQHVLALSATGRVIAWGRENVLRPVGHPGIPPPTPAAVPNITTARAVFAGSVSSQALLADGTMMVWGALPSLWFSVEGGSGDASRFPVPMVVKGL
jgi:Regulator of chromosome condensation (RCC1) repeat